MAIEITIKPEEIDELVKQSITKSMFGSVIEKSVQDALRVGSYNNPIDVAVSQLVTTIARQILAEKFQTQIHEAVAKAIQARVTTEFIDGLVAAAVEKMVKETRY